MRSRRVVRRWAVAVIVALLVGALVTYLARPRHNQPSPVSNSAVEPDDRQENATELDDRQENVTELDDRQDHVTPTELNNDFDRLAIINDAKYETLIAVYQEISKIFVDAVNFPDPRDHDDFGSETAIARRFTDAYRALLHDDNNDPDEVYYAYQILMMFMVRDVLVYKIGIEHRLGKHDFPLSKNPMKDFRRLDAIVGAVRTTMRIIGRIQHSLGIAPNLIYVPASVAEQLAAKNIHVCAEEIRLSEVNVTIRFAAKDLNDDNHPSYLSAISYLEGKVRQLIRDEVVRRAILDALMKEYVRRCDLHPAAAGRLHKSTGQRFEEVDSNACANDSPPSNAKPLSKNLPELTDHRFEEFVPNGWDLVSIPCAA